MVTQALGFLDQLFPCHSRSFAWSHLLLLTEMEERQLLAKAFQPQNPFVQVNAALVEADKGTGY